MFWVNGLRSAEPMLSKKGAAHERRPGWLPYVSLEFVEACLSGHEEECQPPLGKSSFCLDHETALGCMGSCGGVDIRQSLAAQVTS